MEEKNVVFEVTKVGIAVNTKWSVFVDNEYIGKIDFKKNLTKKLSKGRHSVQYKVGLQKTKILNIDVADEDIIVECVWDGTVRNFHVVGGENNTATNNISIVSENKPNNEDYMFCSKCGTKLNKDSTFCNKCGNKIEQPQMQNSNMENQEAQSPNNENINWTRGIAGIIAIIVVIAIGWNSVFGVIWHSIFGNSVDGDYWFSDGSGYVQINKDINSISIYDEYNNRIGGRKVKFTDNKTFVYSDGLLEYTGTINGKKLTIKCENDKMGGYEATKK